MVEANARLLTRRLHYFTLRVAYYHTLWAGFLPALYNWHTGKLYQSRFYLLYSAGVQLCFALGTPYIYKVGASIENTNVNVYKLNSINEWCSIMSSTGYSNSRERVKKYRFLKKFCDSNDNNSVDSSDKDIRDESTDSSDKNLLQAQKDKRSPNQANPSQDLEHCEESSSGVLQQDTSLESFAGCSSFMSVDDDDDNAIAPVSLGADAAPQQTDLMNSGIEIEAPQTLTEKIRQLTLDNIGSVSGFLEILRSEGHTEVPSTAHKLLGFNHRVKTKPMMAYKDQIGDFFYLGIRNGLDKRIDVNVYKEKNIRVLVHIDGLKVYHYSKGGLWPITMKLVTKKYTCSPYVVALFYGRSKPKNVSNFLGDFVDEAKKLILEGITIDGCKFNFEIIAIFADSPARAFLKCIKGPTAFYGCERCTVQGETLNRRRVYPDLKCALRTKENFVTQTDVNHHLRDKNTQQLLVSPLLQIPNFDPVKDFPLDIMHLLFLNVMKNLGEKWVKREKNNYKLSTQQLNEFSNLMNSMKDYVTAEFQRKEFDVEEIGQWKATKCSFLLLYAGGIVLQFVLDDDKYQHFLLLHVACRVLCSDKFITRGLPMAKILLHNFVQLVPIYYGEDSVIMTIHHLSHLCDDAAHFKTSLSHYSAFWGENFIGQLKDFASSRAKPLAQIVNRLSALDSSDSAKVRPRVAIRDVKPEKFPETIKISCEEYSSVKSVTYNDMILHAEEPNNVVELTTENIFVISKLWVKSKCHHSEKSTDDIYLDGFKLHSLNDVFDAPCASREIGIFAIDKLAGSHELVTIGTVKSKCLMMKIKEKYYAVSLLYS
ncbi:uncharacterized protein LOC125777540 [Bactrocera dorsalis]|uniref:Uncharacterized protein LOC125777540 n=1 Tax=Bactrocera dorsalis TaxID=27457 RepID=A0ABM3JHA4_BACDO|nr:uncharacterized protein LOC125777540 [Bactrocera dorsalis]